MEYKYLYLISTGFWKFDIIGFLPHKAYQTSLQTKSILLLIKTESKGLFFNLLDILFPLDLSDHPAKRKPWELVQSLQDAASLSEVFLAERCEDHVDR